MPQTANLSPGMDFLLDALKKDKSASYGDLKAKADEKKLKVFPIMYGRAKAMLGLVQVAKRGEGKRAQAKATSDRPARRGRPPDAESKSAQIRALLGSGMSADEIAKKVGTTRGLVYAVKSNRGRPTARRAAGPGRESPNRGLHALGNIVEAVRSSERERNQLRTALERIQALLAAALD